MKLIRFIILSGLCGAAMTLGMVSTATAQCTNTCATSNDGECDDGGPGSLYSICDLGSDCNDCGARGGALCTNTCSTSNDGECDDGGANSLYSICDLGSDCADCGPRQAAAPTPTPAPAGALCTNTCSTANDSECDDGGPNSLYSICDLGSDCADCGPRVAGGGGLCTNTCSTSNDGECDDGGPNSLYSICDLGSDCNDCGAR